ncbi:MAG: M23 family metallopeptidase [Patescibacteria group bacterium]
MSSFGAKFKKVIRRIYEQKKGSLKDPFLLFGLILAISLLALAFRPIVFSENLDSSLLTKNLQAQISNAPGDSSFDGINQPVLTSSLSVLGPNSFDNSSDLVLVQKDSIMAVSSPVMVLSHSFGVLTGQGIESSLRKEVIEYTLREDDTLVSVAEKFGISLETLIWANNLTKKSKLKSGQALIILPVSGILHYVKKGETLSQIAKNYKSDIGKIVAFNELESEGDIYIGDILIIPDGIMPPPSKKQQKFVNPSSPNQISLPSSYFILPLASPYTISQGLHWYNAVDLTHPGGNSCGRPVFAAAGGEIVRAKAGGWNAGAGNSISVIHPNQVVTAYYHLGSVLVQSGQIVSAGEQIGTIGNTGKTTGCHLHFEVKGASNPFNR